LASTFDINLNINDKTKGQSSGSSKSSPTIDIKALDKLETSIKNLPKDIQKVLFSGVQSKATRTISDFGKTESRGLSKADWKEISKIMGAELATRLFKGTGTIAPKSGGVKATGDAEIDRLLKKMSDNSDKATSELVKKLDSLVKSKTGVGLSQEGFTKLTNELSKIVKGMTPASTGEAIKNTRELSKDVSTLTRSILSLSKEISSMVKSEGGVSVGELLKVLQNMQSMFKNLSSVKKSGTAAVSSYKDVGGELKSIFDELNKNIKNLTNQLGAKVRETKTGLKEEPFKLLQSAISDIKTTMPQGEQYKPLLQKLDKILTGFEKSESIAKEIKEAASEFKTFSKESKKSGVKIEGEGSILNLLKQLEKLGKFIDLKLNTKDIDREIKQIESKEIVVDVSVSPKSLKMIEHKVNEAVGDSLVVL
jgi:prefoldin subunit 5